jgi:hypothetical protein
MNCRICGSGKERGAAWIPERRQNLCISCEMVAPPVTTREKFESVFWARLQPDIPEDTRREIYEDFLSSGLSIKQYMLNSLGLT